MSRGFPADSVRAVLDRLEQEGLLSEARYCDMLVRSRVQQGYGPIRIRFELRQHRIPTEMIEAALEEAEPDWGMLASAVGERRFGPGPDPDIKTRAKRLKYLRNRGFETSDIE